MERSYFITMNLLILHQVDAAFWREWEMMSVPGGIQGFLVINAFLIPLLLFGYKQVLAKTSKAFGFSYFCAGLGILAFILHLVFFLLGHEQFTLPLSALVLLLCFISSIWQIKQIQGLKHGA